MTVVGAELRLCNFRPSVLQAHHDVIENDTDIIKRIPDASRTHTVLGTWQAINGLTIKGSSACLPLEGNPVITTHQSCISGCDHIFLSIFEAHGTSSSSTDVARYLNKRAHAAFLSTNPLDKGDAYISIALREALDDLNRSLQFPSASSSGSSPRSPRISLSYLKKMRRGTAAGALIYINLKRNTVIAAASGGMVICLCRSTGVLSRKSSEYTAIVDCRHQRQENGLVAGLMGPDCTAEVVGGSASLGPSDESILVMTGGLLDLISVSDATCLATCLNDQRLQGVNVSNQIVQQALIQKSDMRRQETDASLVAFSLYHPKSQSSKNGPELEKQSLAKQRWRLLKCYMRFRYLRSRSLLQAWSTVGKQLLKQAEANARKAEERAWKENADVIEVSRTGAIRRSEGAARASEGNAKPNHARVSAGGIGRNRISAAEIVHHAEHVRAPIAEVTAEVTSADISLTYQLECVDQIDKKAVQDQVKPKGLPVPAKKAASRSSKSQINLRGIGQDLSLS